MRARSLLIIRIILLYCNVMVLAQHNVYKRCRCICPSMDSILHPDTSRISQFQTISATVLPNYCNCDNVVLPMLGAKAIEQETLLCQRCECKFESRNPTLIKFVVLMLVTMISFLLAYMIFLTWLRSFLFHRRRFYRHDALPVPVLTEETQELMSVDPDA